MSWFGRFVISFVAIVVLTGGFAAGFYVGNIKPVAPTFIPMGIHSAYIDDVGDVMCFDEEGYYNLGNYIKLLNKEFK
jgi:hypothetical protein